MKKTQVIIVRHGQTQWNLKLIRQGHLDSPLTEKGMAQAKALAQRLAQEKFSALYSSDLGRAVQTAEMIAEQFNQCPSIFDVDATLRPVDGDAYARSRHGIRCGGCRRRLCFEFRRGRRHGERRPCSLQKFPSGNFSLRFGFAHGGILYIKKLLRTTKTRSGNGGTPSVDGSWPSLLFVWGFLTIIREDGFS